MASVIDDGRARAGAGWGWMLVQGIASILLGLFALFDPVTATLAATWLAGVAFLLAGVLALIAGFAGRGHGRRPYLIVWGVLSLLAGLWLTIYPVSGALTLTTVVAVWLGVRGVLELVAGVRSHGHRGALIALGIVNILLAVLIVATMPASGLTLLGYALAISFLAGGATEVAAAVSHRRGAPAFGA